MPKSGQARVLSSQQRRRLFQAIEQHRHPEKNTAIMQIEVWPVKLLNSPFHV